MARIVFVVLIMSFSATKAVKMLPHSDDLDDDPDSCVPGKFYQGEGCSKCFCNAQGTKICGSSGTCQLDDRAPTPDQLIHTFSKDELYKLPSLPNQGVKCEPGGSYRVDCNRCLCLEHNSLMCEKLLCPSYDDVNRLKASEMSGKSCEEGEIEDQDCVKCGCDDGKLACEAKPDCVPPVAEAMTGHLLLRGCIPGKSYPNKHGKRPCKCNPKSGKLRCPIKRNKMLMQNIKGQPFDEAFLDPRSNKKCTPGVIYRRECNTCRCTKKKALRCTTMECLNKQEVMALKRIRMTMHD